ncbi:MAG: DUF1836 domain-containing protein [Clostridiales bacterium]|nr:DUF1836 domain-containing protein [Clostridiales bacterium]
MAHDRIEDVLQKPLNDAVIRPEDLPNLDLYMDQIITLIENGYAPNKRSDKEKLLTTTMIHNYTRDGLIKPVKGKKYTRDHILQMLMIYALKGTLSISEIKQVMLATYKGKEAANVDIQNLYERFLHIKEWEREQALEICRTALGLEDDVDPNDPEGRVLAVLGAASMSMYFQRIAQALVDEYFEAPPVPKPLFGPKEPSHEKKD